MEPLSVRFGEVSRMIWRWIKIYTVSIKRATTFWFWIFFSKNKWRNKRRFPVVLILPLAKHKLPPNWESLRSSWWCYWKLARKETAMWCLVWVLTTTDWRRNAKCSGKNAKKCKTTSLSSTATTKNWPYVGNDKSVKENHWSKSWREPKKIVVLIASYRDNSALFRQILRLSWSRLRISSGKKIKRCLVLMVKSKIYSMKSLDWRNKTKESRNRQQKWRK